MAASCAGDVAIVDRYALRAHLARRDGRSGLRFVLQQLAAQSAVRPVTVYSNDDGLGAAGAIRLLEPLISEVKASGLRSLEFALGPDAVFKQCQHYRYVRFGPFTVQVDTGLELLQGRVAFRDCPVSLRRREDSRKAEGMLRSLLSVNRVI